MFVFTAVGCAGNASSFLSSPALKQLTANALAANTGMRALSSRALSAPTGALIVEYSVTAPVSNSQLAASSISTIDPSLAPPVNASASTMANVAARLDVLANADYVVMLLPDAAVSWSGIVQVPEADVFSYPYASTPGNNGGGGNDYAQGSQLPQPAPYVEPSPSLLWLLCVAGGVALDDISMYPHTFSPPTPPPLLPVCSCCLSSRAASTAASSSPASRTISGWRRRRRKRRRLRRRRVCKRAPTTMAGRVHARAFRVNQETKR